MRFEQLEYVAAVARYGSLRRAAEQLHVSQPAVSEALAKLEQELGVTLLERRRTGARVTAQGRELLQHITQVLDAADQLRAAAGDAGRRRSVRLGTVNAATSSVVAPAVAGFHDAWPGVGVEVLDERQDDVVRGVEEGGLDLGLVNLLGDDDPPPGLVATTLLSGRAVVVLPVDHPLAAREVVDTAELREEPFVMMRAGYLMHRFAHRLFGDQPPRTTVTADGATMGTALVAGGLGLTLLPDYSVVDDPLERGGVLTSRPVRDGAPVSLVLVSRPDRRTPLAVRALSEELVRSAAATSAMMVDRQAGNAKVHSEELAADSA
ncbi:LysR family transcriptional regulator [Nocardioides mangrovicus]|uniref:LysR family transcriptional regulator n=1 Tax=Nocardioides mangrovicus TaxID=2478913 RepID=A0A3L8P8R0_9ACTN|nr:LysR family transcriptional regulator [Nocardioides mangrovicus]RLV51149.1 LysR family transcriptional regulator [Nocardioides mangrovicus]